MLDREKLRAIRLQSGFTQSDAATLLGYTRGAYSHIECGRNKFPPGLYERACKKFEARIKEIAHLLFIEGS